IDGTFQVLPPRPPIQANIAWVSFHPADDTPSAAAAAAGFTEAPDAPYTRLLRDNGHTVTRVLTTPTPDVESLNTYDLVIISRSVGSGDYQDPPETAAWNSVRAPTIVLGGYILRDSRLGYTAGGTMLDTVGPIHLKVNAPGHPLFAGVDLDGQGVMVDPYADVASFNDTVQRGISVNTDAVVAGGVVLATVGTDADPTLGGMVIGEFPAGTLTSNGGADLLGGHRLVLLTGSRENSGLTAEGAGIYDLNAEGAKILLNAVQFMAEPPASPGRNIAWVSFHPAVDTPADDAATAGFTEAADAGYTQLLRDAGHTVTRVVTSGTPDVAYLNTFDLVMISRSVPSGDYQQAEETALWNGIRQPVVILGGYILRNSRLGFTTGGTMVDTAGAVSLKVEAPGHPLFNGLQLDGQDVLLGGYADLASFNGAAQRGISVNTDAPVAGGVVLATIATEADPTFGGMVIGEFPPGIALSNGAGDVLAGPRLVLLTGSREADGLTSQGAGIFDLNDLSSQLVLNAVDYLAHPPGTALGISVDGANLVITWSPEGGVLEESGDLLNWTAVDGASNPATIPIGTGPA
ncbi:MAG: hypothetical protein KDM81_15120, partial [Verrucomicrobiae bacterium]|nr:hypothetical protein [Verrucomicrobiae bacterium]